MNLITKNLFLNSDFIIIPNMNYKKNSYKDLKSKIKELTINNNADIYHSFMMCFNIKTDLCLII